MDVPTNLHKSIDTCASNSLISKTGNAHLNSERLRWGIPALVGTKRTSQEFEGYNDTSNWLVAMSAWTNFEKFVKLAIRFGLVYAFKF